jgi:hypothetical protein
MKHDSEFITIEIVNGGFIISYAVEIPEQPGDDVCGRGQARFRDVREVVPNQRKLVNRIKELVAERGTVQ